MTILASSADVALTTLRSRLEALAAARRLVEDGTVLAWFLDDAARHYQRAIDDLDAGMTPADLVPSILSGAMDAKSRGSFACYASLLDIAQACGVVIDFVVSG